MSLGLLGYARIALNDAIEVDTVIVRRTLTGGRTLSWPTREDKTGRRHAAVRPISDAARTAIEAQVFAELDRQADSEP
jgi:DNA-binding cell septation regulator SpoVG